MDTGYGHSPENLDDFLAALTDEERSQVSTLDEAAHRVASDASLNRFESTGWGIDWNAAPGSRSEFAVDWDHASAFLAGLLESLRSNNDEVIVFWDNLRTPTVMVPTDLAIRHVLDIITDGFDCWLYLPGAGVLAEYRHDGNIRYAPIPAAIV